MASCAQEAQDSVLCHCSDRSKENLEKKVVEQTTVLSSKENGCTSKPACGTIKRMMDNEEIAPEEKKASPKPSESTPKVAAPLVASLPKPPLNNGLTTISDQAFARKMVVNPYFKKKASSASIVDAEPVQATAFVKDASNFALVSGIDAISEDWAAPKISQFIKFNKNIYGSKEETLLIRNSQGTMSRNEKQRVQSLAQFFAALAGHPTLYPLAQMAPNPSVGEPEESIYEILRGSKTPAKWNIMNTVMIIYGKVSGHFWVDCFFFTTLTLSLFRL